MGDNGFVELPPGPAVSHHSAVQPPIQNSFNPVQHQPVSPELTKTAEPEKSTWDNFGENKYSVVALTSIAIIAIIVLAYFFYKWYEDNKNSKKHNPKPVMRTPVMSVEERIDRDTKGYYQPEKREAIAQPPPPPPDSHPPHPEAPDPNEFDDDVEDEPKGESEPSPAELPEPIIGESKNEIPMPDFDAPPPESPSLKERPAMGKLVDLAA